MHYIQENQYHFIFVRFWCISMKNFAQIMGLHFGSVAPPPPPLGEQNFPTQMSNIFATLFHGILVFFQDFPSGGGGQYLLFWDQVLEIAKVSEGDKRPEEGAPCPLWKNAIIGLTCQFRVLPNSIHLPHFTILPLTEGFFTSLVPDIFRILAIFDHRVHTKVVNWNLQILCCFPPPTIAGFKILLNFKKICLVILKIFKNLDSKQDSVTIKHYPGSRKNLNFPSCANSSPLPLNNEVS